MIRQKIEKEVLECIEKHNLELHQDCINTMIGYVLLGGDLDELLSSPLFEYNDIYKEYRELRSSKYKPIVEYTMR